MAAISNCICSQLLGCIGQVFQTFERIRFAAGLTLLSNLLRFIAAIVLLFTIHTATALQWTAAALLVSVVAVSVGIVAVALSVGQPTIAPRLFIQHIGEGFEYSLASSTASVYNDIDKAILTHQGMNAVNGVYSMAYRVVDMATMPVLSMRDAVFPRMFREGKGCIQGANALSGRVLALSIAISTLVGVAILIGAPVLPVIAGPRFRESAAILRWLCPLPMFRALHQIAGTALTGSGLQRYRTMNQFIAAGMNLGLNLWLIPRFGWHGAASASLVTDAALGTMNWAALSSAKRGHKHDFLGLRSSVPA
jgi:O-antigen/teichoic acid export membrane protein